MKVKKKAIKQIWTDEKGGEPLARNLDISGRFAVMMCVWSRNMSIIN
jgi:hypothetical protein